MGSRLRSLKKRSGKNKLEDGKSIGGRGRLTDKVIDKIQVYYGRAIRDNSASINNNRQHACMHLKDAVMAIWIHTQSTDVEPLHNLCPAGEDSWCGFQRDLAKGTCEYAHSHPLPKAISKAILPAFTALSNEALLTSCLHGGTQNQNEAFNALIWQRATKETHSGLLTVELATFLAVCHFNDGAKSILKILENLDICPGANTTRACSKLFCQILGDIANIS